MTPTARLSSAWIAAAVAAALLAVQYGLAVSSKRSHSTTSDELVHLTGGYTYWKFQDYRLHPENGNLPQRWAALPAWLGGAQAPVLEDSVYWRTSDSWMIGHEFFYRRGNDHAFWLFTGRAMIAVFAIATGILIFMWSRRLWGELGAVIAVGFYAFCPTVLAHGALVTSDICMTFFFLASAGAYWRHLHAGSWGRWILSTLAFGLACVAKYSAVLLLPMMALIAIIRALHPEPLRLGRRQFTGWFLKLGVIGTSTLVHGFIAVAVIWLFFGFRYAAFNPALPAADHFIRPWEIILPRIGLHADAVEFCRSWKLLPEGYLYGYAYTIESVIARGAFLDGEYSDHGWVSFFPKAFLYKTPFATMLALALCAVLAWRRWASLTKPRWAATIIRLYPLTPLLVLLSVYWAFSLTSHLNIGHRHILPTYPVLFILLGLLGPALKRARALHRGGGALLVALVIALWGGLVVASCRIWPHYLAYFNAIAGGPEQGYRHLVDSSLDWGQDLPGLKRWLDANRRPDEPLYLSYFGTSTPEYYGIDAVLMPMINDFDQPRPWYWPEPGIYAVSATMLQHVYMTHRGPWTLDKEVQYQAFRQIESQFRMLKADPYGHPELFETADPLEWAKRWRLFEQLRFARLCHYLRARQPDAMIGYSILIYRITSHQLDIVLQRNYSEWLKAIEQARTGTR